jgi:hypothetical protein
VPGGQRLGAGGSETKQGTAVRGADRRARQHSAARFGFKPIQTESKIFQMVQTDLKFFKFWLVQKVPSRAPKNWNKIWMERDWDEEQLFLKKFTHIRNGFGTKIQRTSMSWISLEIHWKFLEI